MEIEFLNNGKWIKTNEFKSWKTVDVTKLPYMGDGTVWTYYVISSTILKSLNIIRVKHGELDAPTLRLKYLEDLGAKENVSKRK